MFDGKFQNFLSLFIVIISLLVNLCDAMPLPKEMTKAVDDWFVAPPDGRFVNATRWARDSHLGLTYLMEAMSRMWSD